MVFGVQRPAVVDARWNMLHPRDSKGRFTRSFTRVLKPADNRLARKIVAAFSGRSFASPAARKGFFASFGGPDGASTTRRAFASGELKSAHRAVRTEKAAVDSPIVRAIDAEMRPLPHDIEVHRRVNQARFGQVPVEELEGYKVRDAGWVFATLDPDPDPTGIHMRIKVPAGVRGVVLDEERGLLALDRELEMAITSVEPNGRGGFDMDMVVLHRAKRGEQTGGAEQDRTERTAAGTADGGDGDGEDQTELPLEPTPAVGAEDDSTPAAPPQPGTPEPPFVAEPVPNPVMPRPGTPDERVRFVDDPELVAFRQPLTTPGDMREYRAAPHLWVRIHRDGDAFEVSDRGVWGNTDPDSVARFGSEDDARREIAFRMAEAQGGDLPAGERPERLGDEPAEPTADERIAELRGLDPGMVPGYVQALKGARLTAVARALKVNRGRVADKRAAIVAALAPEPAAVQPLPAEDAQAVPPVKWSHETRALESGLENDPERDEISAALRDWVYDKASSEAIVQGRGDQVDAANAAEPYVNAALRGRADMTPGRARSIGLLDKAFDASHIDRPITVYRGYSDGAGILPDDWLDRDLAGLEWDNAGFTATTVDRDGAETYAGAEEDRGFAVRLHLPEGFPAIAIRDEPGGLDDEGEILLPRDLQFRVVADSGVQGDYGVRWLDVEATEKPRAPLVVAGESQQDGSEEPVVDDPLEQARREARRTPTAAGHRENLSAVTSRQEARAYIGELDDAQLDALLAAIPGAEPGDGSTDGKRSAALDAVVGQRFPASTPVPTAAVGVPEDVATAPNTDAAVSRLVYGGEDEAADGQADAKAVAKEIYAGTFAGGFSTRVGKVTTAGGSTIVSGFVFADEGGKAKRVGTFVRGFERRPGGSVAVTHEELKVDKGRQGSGFALSFNAQAEAWYREHGIDRIRLNANIDVGSYAWARAGYDWADEQSARKILERVGRVMRLIDADSRIPQDRKAEQADLARRFLDRAEGSSFGDDGFPTPYEVSQLGRWSGAGRDDFWLGKAAMWGAAWDGVRPLAQEGASARIQRMDALGGWHNEWSGDVIPRAEAHFDPSGHPDDTDLNVHAQDWFADGNDEDAYAERADEIVGGSWLDDDSGDDGTPAAPGQSWLDDEDLRGPAPEAVAPDAEAPSTDSPPVLPSWLDDDGSGEPDGRTAVGQAASGATAGQFGAPARGVEPTRNAARYHLDLAGIEDLAEAVENPAQPREERPLTGGVSADTELVTTADGTRLVRKSGGNPEAELGASLIAQALGVRAPRVYRNHPSTVWMDYVDGAQTGAELWDSGRGGEIQRHVESDAGKLVGLLDMMIANGDRNEGNWLIDGEGDLFAIDHGHAFPSTMYPPAGRRVRPRALRLGPFADNYVGAGGWVDNDLTPADVEQIRQRLTGLRPSFDHMGRLQWLEYALAVLDAVEPYAKGSRDLAGRGDRKNGDVTPASVASKVNLANEKSLADRVERELDTAERTTIVAGAQGGVKERLTLSDGSRVFSKGYSPADPKADQIVDAEELAGLVAQAVGAPVPAVYRRDGELRVFTEWADGTALHTARRRRNGKERADALLDSPAGKRLGLLDLLVHNHDRHENNLMVDRQERLVGIDQGLAWNGAHWLIAEPRFAENRMMGFLQGPAARHFVSGDDRSKLGPNPLTADDVAVIRERLNALRPAFERRGRGDWLDATLLILDMLESRAAGEGSIFDG